VRFEVLSAVKVIVFFWVLTPCGLKMQTLVSTYEFTRRHNLEQHRHGKSGVINHLQSNTAVRPKNNAFYAKVL
jgi:hypothetical protein